ncbi:conserved hypothetical protein [Ixodes scapularis]|uniref:Uncharacterized protein n=1 Tax=Ixodes scapularis TaxID=6945 RepID=B7PJ78_IXOSC|nr:conserved hypothetical protein [Ixodes scapularis]|eukprot:XP_002407257.1 conserved hypothetical protein [Ixodes scapularis]
MLNVACIHLMLQYCNPTYTAVTWGFLGNTDETLFILINFSALMMNALFFISCILSVATAVALSKSVLVLGIVNSLLYLCSVLAAYWTCKSSRY